MRPDLAVWSKRGRVVVVGELAVPWEDNIDERNEFKRAKYLDLVHECKGRGWTVFCYPSNTLPLFFSRLAEGSQLRQNPMPQAPPAGGQPGCEGNTILDIH